MYVEMVGGPRDGDRILMAQPLPVSLQVEHLGVIHTYTRASTLTVKTSKYVWTGYPQ